MSDQVINRTRLFPTFHMSNQNIIQAADYCPCQCLNTITVDHNEIRLHLRNKMRETINRFPQIAVHKIGVFMVDKGVDVVETTFVDFVNRLSILAVHMHAGGKNMYIKFREILCHPNQRLDLTEVCPCTCQENDAFHYYS